MRCVRLRFLQPSPAQPFSSAHASTTCQLLRHRCWLYDRMKLYTALDRMRSVRAPEAMSRGQPRRTHGGWEQDPALQVVMWTDNVTMREPLEATARSIGDSPIERRDAAAIATVEASATWAKVVYPRGLADANTVVAREEHKAKLGEVVLGDAAVMIPADMEVTREDAARMARAEISSSSLDLEKRPGGVADSVAATAQLNERP